ncbi:sieve element occlusion [Artemisia annua]|uniref:Sieve element occlusion n=1 Tax=Artemisia annua TaxID=35608 RepID=A0A2U1M106_ARTAN|nr:sieve element occlusion [Artemisia annua]
MVLFDLNEPVMLDPITGDVIDDSITNGVVEESVSADVVNSCDGSDGVVEESVSTVVVNVSDSLDGFVNSVSSSTDGVPVSNGDQVASCLPHSCLNPKKKSILTSIDIRTLREMTNVYNQKYESVASFWLDFPRIILIGLIISQFTLLKQAANSTPFLLIGPRSQKEQPVISCVLIHGSLSATICPTCTVEIGFRTKYDPSPHSPVTRTYVNMSMLHSKLQYGKSFDEDPILREIGVMLAYDSDDQGWTDICCRSNDWMRRANGDTVLSSLINYKEWLDEAQGRGFITA